MNLILIRSIGLSIAVISLFGCFSSINASICSSVCNENACAPATGCLSGMVKDRCNCCYVCGQLEGQRCFNRSIVGLPLINQKFGTCGDMLECRLRDDMAEGDKPEAICVCTSDEPICASDGKTYDNVCRLTEARYKQRDGLVALARGPCKQAPKIITPPSDLRNSTGQNVVFSCEASGYPIPTIEWKFVAARLNASKQFSESNSDERPEMEYEEETVSSMKSLPSDDSHIAVQARGGPSPYAITSWLQVLRAQSSDSGKYICVASNSQGEEQVFGTLWIDSNSDAAATESFRL